MRAAKMDALQFIGGRMSLPLRNRRSKRDLEICGCSVCREALKILDKKMT